jgi:hypothetical protein
MTLRATPKPFSIRQPQWPLVAVNFDYAVFAARPVPSMVASMFGIHRKKGVRTATSLMYRQKEAQEHAKACAGKRKISKVTT